ncbi:MAG TPA: hypothetical protein VFW07_04280 [Parafilimonas sp.]|nr:hypothetical protein [Parafilimonas sp.]
MRRILLIVVTVLYAGFLPGTRAQKIDEVKFFEEDSIINAKLSMDISKFIKSSSKPAYMPATFTCTIGDSIVSEEIRIEARGNVRRQICYMPPIKMNFHNPASPKLYPLNTLKMVGPCKTNEEHDQLVLKEYLIYKMYNLLTEKSFRVRLLNLRFEDSKGNKKSFNQHAFLIESTKEMAKRSACKAFKNTKINTENTNRGQMTLVAIFEYMIGNTDWSVPGGHNIVLMQLKKDSTARPFVVGYDFDYAGLVNAEYAVPTEDLGLESVRERLYRGFSRTPDELNTAIAVFNDKKDSIYSLIKNFTLLTERNRGEIIQYLDDFYKTINNKNQVKSVFIEGARRM